MSHEINIDIDGYLAIDDPAEAGAVLGRVVAAIEAQLFAEPSYFRQGHRLTTRSQRR